MASQLGIYNEAMEHLGERPLASLAEEREPRRALDGAWERTVEFCLEAGYWNFALRSVEVEAEAGIEPAFGFAYAFVKPTDWVRTFVVSPVDTFTFVENFPFIDENHYWLCDTDPLYVRYVSDGDDYGWNETKWPNTFAAYVALALARRICRRVTNSSDMYETLFKLESRAKIEAMSKDAQNEGPQRPPYGSWVRSRGSMVNASGWNEKFR